MLGFGLGSVPDLHVSLEFETSHRLNLQPVSFGLLSERERCLHCPLVEKETSGYVSVNSMVCVKHIILSSVCVHLNDYESPG